MSFYNYCLNTKTSPEYDHLLKQFESITNEYRDLGIKLLSNIVIKSETPIVTRVVSSMLRDNIDSLDALSVLHAKSISCVDKLLIRREFETLINVKFILEKDSFKRSRYYVLNALLNKKKIIKNKTKHLRVPDDKKDLVQNKLNQDILILDEKLSTFTEEYLAHKKVSKKNKRFPEWFQAYDSNIKSRFTLATQLNLLDLYNFIYKECSMKTHSLDSLESVNPDNHLQLRHFRDIRESKNYLPYLMMIQEQLFQACAAYSNEDISSDLTKIRLIYKDICDYEVFIEVD